MGLKYKIIWKNIVTLYLTYMLVASIILAYGGTGLDVMAAGFLTGFVFALFDCNLIEVKK